MEVVDPAHVAGLVVLVEQLNPPADDARSRRRHLLASLRSGGLEVVDSALVLPVQEVIAAGDPDLPLRLRELRVVHEIHAGIAHDGRVLGVAPGRIAVVQARPL
jgi:hypothetical protein